MKKPSKALLIIQMVLTLIGIASVVVMLLNTSVSGVALLQAVFFLIAYAFLVYYAVLRHGGDVKYFKLPVYAYAALLGVQILTSGHMMSNQGLSETTTLVVNIVNLICFANVIKFSDHLDDIKVSLTYLGVAVILKLLVEVALCVMMAHFIQPVHVFVALATPIMGATILVAYMNRYGK